MDLEFINQKLAEVEKDLVDTQQKFHVLIGQKASLLMVADKLKATEEMQNQFNNEAGELCQA